ncbi:tRNA glutamyl-Q(34) synthetase GluQRS [Marichromatium bheemlicum]|uniref:Glutamyl-Q tRNA(Asp) synthetase n=1 Tax=Marichromatium bheemlicum TaxID=365339 RepID=A0ABX1I3Z8_9GAMM|nr:tRNA glutamyl-Q(34) synthetase GluQRS [Marichromatium bheemlicum]NKN32272.1 tRNA glutamyl-Q(34) synthetase GluQRS [Marichromatium bheemlicum]
MIAGYRGRFAPSPTGPLHFGSLVTAVASHADARAHGGEWLVRIEDLDRPREVAGAAQAILDTLAAFGMHHDGPVCYQHDRLAAYDAALAQLAARGLTYPCGCSRAEVARHGHRGSEGTIYPGTCRAGLPPGRTPRTIRMRTDEAVIAFDDRVFGRRSQHLEREVGDFVLHRADAIHAYQLAVVVDDAWQGIDQVVRGADLLDSTPRQIWLQRALGLPLPHYAHLPLVLDPEGRKLSKRLAAAPVDPAAPLPALHRAWAFLGQPPPPPDCTLQRFWEHAITHWRIERVPPTRSAPLPADQ